MSEIIKINTGATIKGQVTAVKAFEIYPLVDEHDPILHQPAKFFDLKEPPIEPVHLAHSLFESLFHYKGLGLAAPQVGIPYNVIVVGYDDENKQILFNPEIVATSEEMEVEKEGCLSYNKLFLSIPRHTWINVKYQWITGEWKEDHYTGLTARVLAHEIDHLSGVTFTDRVGKLTFKLANEKRMNLQKKAYRALKKTIKSK